MNVLSLFDGCSCAFQALNNLGMPVIRYYASEVDKYAIMVSQMNHKNIVHLGDVKQIFFKDCLHYGNIARHEINKIDLLIGGPPCQDLSIAGKRKGLGGERSGLFREYVRILREVKPKRFIMENVASMSKEARDTISKELGVEPIMINSALVTAQNRKRLYWTNIPGVGQPLDQELYIPSIVQKDVGDEYNLSERMQATIQGWGAKQKAKGNSFHPTIVDIDSKVKSSTIKATYWKIQGDGIYIIQRARGFNKGGEHHEKSPTLGSNSRQQNNMLHEGDRIRKLTPIECERLQGLPDNYTEGVSNTQRYKMIGNGFTVTVIEHILSFLPK